MRLEPLDPLALDLVRFARVATGVSIPSPHCLSSGVFNKSPTPSVFRWVYEFGGGGEGVDKGADDAAVVPEAADGTRKLCLAGVDKPEPMDSDRSGIVPPEWFRDRSGCELSAADIAACYEVLHDGSRTSEPLKCSDTTRLHGELMVIP